MALRSVLISEGLGKVKWAHRSGWRCGVDRVQDTRPRRCGVDGVRDTRPPTSRQSGPAPGQPDRRAPRPGRAPHTAGRRSPADAGSTGGCPEVPRGEPPSDRHRETQRHTDRHRGGQERRHRLGEMAGMAQSANQRNTDKQLKCGRMMTGSLPRSQGELVARDKW